MFHKILNKHNNLKIEKNMKSISIFIGILLGFALSYIPNNYMDEIYQDIAFYLVLGIIITGVVWRVISNNKLKSKK